MNQRSDTCWRRGGLALAAAALAAIVGALLRERGGLDVWTLVHWIGKPLATAVLVVLAWRVGEAGDARLRRGVLAGLVFSLAGDVLLMLSPRLFVGGLLAFLVAHLCYLRAFTVDTRLFARVLPLAALGAVGLAVLAFLWGGLAPALRGPVIAYVVVLVAMAAQAIVRWQEHPEPGTRMAAIGAVLFVVSDALLATDRFRSPIAAAPVWVLGTYWAAQWGIAQSLRRAQRQ
ncbi:MAG TPA: lysoplasmalogenase [Burkholderiaceae bacterium]|nr:lysoplasmalogenase [Burkholderiaceae bacterium]